MEFSMEAEEREKSRAPGLLSRREFLAASAALVAVAAFDSRAMADPADGEGGSITGEAFEQARRRASALVDRMTVEEVVGQAGNVTPALPHLGLKRYNYWTEGLHGVVVNGPITSFPQPIALGCTWNPELIHQVYTAVSDEARAYHNKTGHPLAFFSPSTVNMGLRDPRWGRVEENFSEDPWLVQTLAVETIRGMQGDNPKYLKTVACAKHFICNDTDSDRMYANATPDHRSFWEYYTRGFEAAVTRGHVFSVMAAYNELWGIPCPANHMLLTGILRDRWGFKGYVVSDCDAIANIYTTHHYVETGAEASAAAIKAGSDLNCGRTLQNFLMASIRSNLVSEAEVRAALVRVITGRFLLGEFDPPDAVPWSKISPSILEDRPHRELAREAARQSLVLLKNEGNLLPLDKEKIKSVAVIGPMAGSCHLGGYSGVATHLVSPYEGIAAALGVTLFANGVPAGEYLNSSIFRGPRFEGPAVGFSEDGQEFLTDIKNGAWAQYGPLDFTGKTSIEFDIASIADGAINLHLDSLDAGPFLTVKIPSTGSFGAWKTVSAQLSGITGRHIVFLRFTTAVAKYFLRLRSFKLLPAPPAEPPSVKVTYAPGCSIAGSKIDALFNAAVKAASEADVAIVFAGDNQSIDREAHDRYFLHLPGVQHDLIRAVVAANQRAILVVNSNCPVAINAEQETVPAILCALFGGEQQGNAIADALFGACNPGGKLASTWYRSVDQLPNFHDYDIKHGRTYMYFRGDPLYPFGHGLSYTSFSYRHLRVDGEKLSPGGSIRLTVDIENSGRIAGDEIVQFYVHAGGPVQRPIKQLAAFRRISLRPGETQTVAFRLPHDHMALRYWDEAKHEFTCAPGNVDLLVGSSSADIRLRGKVMLIQEDAG